MRLAPLAATLQATSSKEETMTAIEERNEAHTEQRRGYWLLSRLFVLHVGGEETDGQVSLVEGLLPPGAMTPLHVLPRVDQTLYVVEGELTAYLPGVERVLRSGDSMLQPAGVLQTHRVTSSEPARVLAISSPAGFERFFVEAGRPAEALTLPPLDESPPDLERLAEVAAKHGMEIIGPPGSLPAEAAIVIPASAERSEPASTADRKRLARRFHGDIFEQNKLEVADEILTADFRWHNAALPSDISGPKGVKQFAQLLRAAFPDYRLTSEDMIADGDRVVIRWTQRGTHEGEFLGVSPTGKTVTISGIDLFRIEGAKIVELWQMTDQFGLMQQRGAIAQTAREA
jgi:steroid delta-isomerase-like uncharacterized protein